MPQFELDMKSWFYKNCVRNRKVGAKICQVCPFREWIEEQEVAAIQRVGLRSLARTIDDAIIADAQASIESGRANISEICEKTLDEMEPPILNEDFTPCDEITRPYRECREVDHEHMREILSGYPKRTRELLDHWQRLALALMDGFNVNPCDLCEESQVEKDAGCPRCHRYSCWTDTPVEEEAIPEDEKAYQCHDCGKVAPPVSTLEKDDEGNPVCPCGSSDLRWLF